MQVKRFTAQKLDIILPCWGPRVADALTCCLASLLAPGNLPALRGRVRVTIATRPADRQALFDSPLLKRVSAFAEVSVDVIEAPSGAAPHALLSSGHLLGARRAAEDKSLAMYLCADSLVTDEALPKLAAAAQGKKAVMSVPWAISASAARQEIERARTPPGALAVSARLGARLAALWPDPQYLQWQMSLPRLNAAEHPYCPWWRVCEDGILVHSLWYQPAIVNFSQILQHDTRGLERWTYDGNYMSRNAAFEECAFLQDSDDYLALFVRPQGEWRAAGDDKPVEPHDAIARGLGHPMTDCLKRAGAGLPFRIHGSSLDGRWKAVEEQAARIMTAARDAIDLRQRRGPSEPPFLLETLGAMNLVAYDDRIFVVPRRLGAIALDALSNPEELGIRCCETVEAARAAAYLSPERMPPELLETVGSTNLVAYDERVFAIPQSLGPVALDSLSNPEALGIRCYETIEAARAAAAST